MPILDIMLYAILVWARFWQNCWPNHYHSLSSSRSNSKNYDVEFEHVQTTWYLMKCDDREQNKTESKTADLTTIINYRPLVQTAKTMMSNLNMSKLHDIWWNAMIEHDSSCSNALDSWNYRQLSWPLNGASVFLLRPWWKAIIVRTGSG